MPVTDQQAATLHAQLAGDLTEYERLLAGLDNKADALGYSALLTAAFRNAVDRRFTRDSTLDEVTDFVAGVRARSERLRDALDPRVAERVIVTTVGGNHVRDLAPAESNKMKMVLLTALVADMHLDHAGLDEFMAKARTFADELLSS
jgi:hypothetical protein